MRRLVAVLVLWAGGTVPPVQESRAVLVLEPVQVRPSDAALLAMVAKTEDPQAGEAVMWTVINRARATGRTPREEATRPRAYHGLETSRADWTAGDRAQLARLERRAAAVLAGRVPDPTGGATHFHRVGSWTPAWAPGEESWTRLGSHAFYRAAR